VLPGRLGGLPRPGIVQSLERDLDGLVRLGVTTLITLEEERSVDAHQLARVQIASLHFPVADMGVPRVEDAAALCRTVEGRIGEGGVVAMHCRAGLGRTGTLLACQLVFGGEPALGALERVRRLNPRSIQSQEQVDFLSVFENFLRTGAPAAGTRAVS
jgi:atypical dual specificity phosphatase